MSNFRTRNLVADSYSSNIIDGTSTIAYSVLLDLLDHPDTLAEIKDEINRVKKEELGGGPIWTRHGLGDLRLVDSFMKETHRMHPFTEGRPTTASLQAARGYDLLRSLMRVQ